MLMGQNTFNKSINSSVNRQRNSNLPLNLSPDAPRLLFQGQSIIYGIPGTKRPIGNDDIDRLRDAFTKRKKFSVEYSESDPDFTKRTVK